ncbi:sugar transferase [Porphyromonas bennonis]|uniref:sugar transferase n=1 Tax=Porphyromonas bennonis TaxID=501496 RepID=UPI00036F5657
MSSTIYQNYIKRVLDFVFALLLLILLSPLLLVVTIWLHFANKGAGAFFTQERPGKNEKIFKLYKFKSMTDERDAEGYLLPDAERITRAGRFVRSTSIDELPQLWNVLKGDMSFIGPRPLLVRYLPYYTEREHRRHDVRPGITGLSQVSGRNNLKWDERLEMDVRYVEEICFILDIRIAIDTIKKVFGQENIVVVMDPTVNVPLDEYRRNRN